MKRMADIIGCFGSNLVWWFWGRRRQGAQKAGGGVEGEEEEAIAHAPMMNETDD